MTELQPCLAVEMVHTLEDHGLPKDAYQLASEFDPEALERLLESADQSIEVRLEVQGIPLVVTSEEIQVLEE
ncbi:HalOD1 output domain-containing protein [Halostagnicola bangensis]